MAIVIRSSREIAKVKESGMIVGEVLSKMKNTARLGMSTAELNEIAEQVLKDTGSVGLFKGVDGGPGVRPFPAVTCISINEQVVHGIPSPKRLLAEGDIVSVDFGVKRGGYCGDAATTFGIGRVSSDKQHLMDVTRKVLDIAVEMIRPGIRWSRIAAKMQQAAESAGCSVVRDLVGHGIGTELHADPQVPNYAGWGSNMSDFTLKQGMIIAVEPMITLGGYKIRTLNDGWTVVTADGSPAAHYEHTIAVVKDGCEVLTLN
ncbi:Methionine aminopeptidase 1 [Limihaloglobus sulfuriphilus]|uniref:Methionine aminopeptidase n=1 Tax=Limihaloglobus sulfuriphilus TaxID=1851148 RepID=A0A1Q2MH52_9BACT|nr:type I methionyl aminopeptidase [Limihaloglobus sulfuriphilus]AQQ72035.1 Methionine aminopeptidase 1 [Limihaloglobus sulfuriphilus]